MNDRQIVRKYVCRRCGSFVLTNEASPPKCIYCGDTKYAEGSPVEVLGKYFKTIFVENTKSYKGE